MRRCKYLLANILDYFSWSVLSTFPSSIHKLHNCAFLRNSTAIITFIKSLTVLKFYTRPKLQYNQIICYLNCRSVFARFIRRFCSLFVNFWILINFFIFFQVCICFVTNFSAFWILIIFLIFLFNFIVIFRSFFCNICSILLIIYFCICIGFRFFRFCSGGFGFLKRRGFLF